jgi:hypothetical protein
MDVGPYMSADTVAAASILKNNAVFKEFSGAAGPKEARVVRDTLRHEPGNVTL